MSWIYLSIAAIAIAFCGRCIYGIRKASHDDLANAHKINADLSKAIADARKVNAELEHSIMVLQQAIDLGVENIIRDINKERADHHESGRLMKILKLFQSAQPDLDNLCGILLDAELSHKPLDNETLLRCHALAALGSANSGTNSARYREQLAQIEEECAQRALPLTILTPSVLLAAWGRA